MKKERSGKKITVFLIVIIATIIALACALMVFTIQNRKRITNQNREYLVDNAKQVARSIDSALSDGYDNINILSKLVSNSLTAPEFDITSMQEMIKNSVFDFMEFADKDGMDHNITGGVSDARDRQYYLDAKEGNSGMELIHVSRATHETLLMFYAPIYFEDEFVGSLVGVYQASNRLTNLLSSEYFGEKATAYLATEKQRIIASNQGFDPQNEMYIVDLADEDSLKMRLKSGVGSSNYITFTLPENETGGCMVKLPKNGGYVVQIFPHKASARMISKANMLGFLLVAFLVLVYLVVLFALIKFYRNQQKQIEEAKNQAEVANGYKTDFLFNMSHDIRTPMNAIIGFTNVAKKNLDDKEKLIDSLNKTQQSSQLLLSLINSILDMSRIESGKAVLDEVPGNVRFSFENIKSTAMELASAKNIDLSFEIGKISDSYVLIDLDRCIRIFMNIITNSIKYTKDGGWVKVKCEQIGKRDDGYGLYQYTFEDNGIGMSEEFQERVYDQFAREENSTTRGIQGTGLGLSVVKSFVNLMGGTIECKSKQGVGTYNVPYKVDTTRERDCLKC